MTLSVISNSPTAVIFTSREIVAAMVLKSGKGKRVFSRFFFSRERRKELILVRALVRRLRAVQFRLRIIRENEFTLVVEKYQKSGRNARENATVDEWRFAFFPGTQISGLRLHLPDYPPLRIKYFTKLKRAIKDAVIL